MTMMLNQAIAPTAAEPKFQTTSTELTAPMKVVAITAIRVSRMPYL